MNPTLGGLRLIVCSIDPMSNRLSDAFSKMNVGENSRGSFAGGRPPISPGPKRSSGLDQDQIYNMFPEAAAAIETQKSDFRQKTGTEPRSNRSSAAIGERSSLAAPSINAPGDDARRPSLAQPSPWGQRNTESQAAISRPKSSSGQQPMGQFTNPPPSAGPRSSRLPITGDNNIQSTTLNAPEQNQAMPKISRLTASGNWGSMMNTPMVPNFNQQDGANNANMVANATAMKLASLSTINNRVQLDDARKYRRSRSQEGRGNQPTSPVPGSAGFPNDFVMTNGMGQMLSPQQAAMAMQAQQLAAMNGQQQRSRPSSPGGILPGHGMANINLAGTSNNGFLAAYNNQGGMFNGGLSSFGSEGYLSDGNEIQRGRSPRGKRGTSRPPEDPTNPELLNDIPAWLRSLRLHKYTDNLKNIKWTDLVQMDEAELEKHGVAAQGARRKMIKVTWAQRSLPLSLDANDMCRRSSKKSEPLRLSVKSSTLPGLQALEDIIST